MKFNIITLFPEFFNQLTGLIQTARETEKFSLEVTELRSFGSGKHKKVDDQVFGGSDGMLIKSEVLKSCLENIKSQEEFKNAEVIYLSPKGQLWNQQKAESWAKEKKPKILICGRYAGIDQRFIDKYCDQEVSIGNYILNGGEIASLVVVESVARLLENVLGNTESPIKDSFSDDTNLLEAPQYTRPQEWEGLKVPEVFLSGNHKKIEETSKILSLSETFLKRKELLTEVQIDEFCASLIKIKDLGFLAEVYSLSEIKLLEATVFRITGQTFKVVK